MTLTQDTYDHQLAMTNTQAEYDHWLLLPIHSAIPQEQVLAMTLTQDMTIS